MKRIVMFVALVGCCICPMIAQAQQFRVRVLSGGSLISSTETFVSDGYNVSLNVLVAGTGQTALAVVDTSSENVLKHLSVQITKPSGAGNVQCNLVVQGTGTSGRVVRCESIAKNVASDAGTDLLVGLVHVRKTSGGAEGNIGHAGTSPGGSIVANSIGELRTEGHLTAGVNVVDGVFNPQHNISFLNITGNIYGDIDASHGSIIRIESGGTVGTISSPVSIEAGTSMVGTSGVLERLVAGEIHAHIATNSTGLIQHIQTTGAGSLNGDFTGSLFTNNIAVNNGANPQGFEIAGDLLAEILVVDSALLPVTIFGDVDADITVGEVLDADMVIGGDLLTFLFVGTLDAARAILIDGSLDSLGEILLGSSGLEGQIVINANPSLSGTWDGDVTVGSTTLATAPYYSNLPSTLGGGAVGLAPYQIHSAACVW